MEIQKVLQSILLNAMDAIIAKEEKHNEQIVISVKKETIEKLHYASISICNSGPLIPEKDLHRLFDPFYTTKSHENAAGLGLSVSFNIVRQHKGLLTVQNIDDLVVFTLSLPID